MEPVSVLSNALSIIDRLKSTYEGAQEQHFRELLSDLSLELSEFKMQLANSQTEVARLTKEKLELEKRLSIDEKPTIQSNAYKFKDDETFYCIKCFHERRDKCPVLITLDQQGRKCAVCGDFNYKNGILTNEPCNYSDPSHLI